MPDYLIDFPTDFAATTVTVHFLSDSLRERNDGAVSVNVTKSNLPAYTAHLNRLGYFGGARRPVGARI